MQFTYLILKPFELWGRKRSVTTRSGETVPPECLEAVFCLKTNACYYLNSRCADKYPQLHAKKTERVDIASREALPATRKVRFTDSSSDEGICVPRGSADDEPSQPASSSSHPVSSSPPLLLLLPSLLLLPARVKLTLKQWQSGNSTNPFYLTTRVCLLQFHGRLYWLT